MLRKEETEKEEKTENRKSEELKNWQIETWTSKIEIRNYVFEKNTAWIDKIALVVSLGLRYQKFDQNQDGIIIHGNRTMWSKRELAIPYQISYHVSLKSKRFLNK